MASLLQVKHAIGLNSGTDALYLSLLALGIRSGDEVITVAHTFAATVGAIVHCGATPVLVDVCDDFNIDPELAAQAITSRTKAIIPVHLNGRMCDMDKVMALATSHGLAVVEDAAQALGAAFRGRPAGSFGTTSCFSFYPAKILGAPGDGGMVLANSDELARKLRGLRDNGRLSRQEPLACYGFNSRLDNLYAAILAVKLSHLDRYIARRRTLARMYHESLGELEWLTLPPAPEDNGPYYDVFQNYVIRTRHRDALMQHLAQLRIETLASWTLPLHRQPMLGLSSFSLPNTESISREVLSLPLYPELSDDECCLVVDAIKSFVPQSR